jgi:hypothetical protein
MSDFSIQTDNFVKYGTYEYKFDEAGNISLNSASSDFNRNYVAIPLQDFHYNTNKILTYYDVDFTEFIPNITSSISQSSTPDQLQTQLDTLINMNQSLTEQLNFAIETANQNTTTAQQNAVQQVIIELRKQLGQGRVDSDFSTDFPYTPIIKPTI